MENWNMPKFTDKQNLFDALKKLGIDDPLADNLANEQLRSGIPHVETISFLRIVNSFVWTLENPESLQRMKNISEDELERNPFAKSVRRMLELGVSSLDIKIVIREMQYELLEQVFSLLDNISDYDGFPIDEFNLYAINEETNEPEVLIDGLHECISLMRRW
jgi:hypothetical protein